MISTSLLFFKRALSPCLWWLQSIKVKSNANYSPNQVQKQWSWTYLRWKTICLQQRFCQTCQRRSNGWMPWCQWWCQWNRPKERGSWGHGWHLSGLWTRSDVNRSHWWGQCKSTEVNDVTWMIMTRSGHVNKPIRYRMVKNEEEKNRSNYYISSNGCQMEILNLKQEWSNT